MALTLSAPGRTDSASRPVAVGLLVVSVFLLGGGSRPDILSLLLLRPIGAMALIFALLRYGGAFWTNHRALAWLAACLILLPIVQLIALPPAVWTALPGRELVAEVFRSSGMDLPWQSLSLTPVATLNALFAVFLPVALLIMVAVLARTQQLSLLRLVLVMGALSGLMGLLQAIGSQDSALYLYRITNNGMAVGLFANRNHQAIFLASLIPLLAAHVSLYSGRSERVRVQKVVGVAAGLFIIPLILVTGSRNGLLLLVFALPMAYWLYQDPKIIGRNIEMSRSGRLTLIIQGGVVTALVALLAFASFRAPALSRLLAEDAVEDLRWTALPTVLDAAGDVFPFGSGLGSFAEIYKNYEPDALLSPKYFNHAHNDYVEILLTAGLPGLLILLFAALLLVVAVRRVVRPPAQLEQAGDELVLARAGTAVLVLLAISSIGDYPVRTPSLASLAALAAAWIVAAFRRSSSLKLPVSG